MHSLADCHLRTFCSITTADYAPFPIISIDYPALDLILLSSNTPAASSLFHSSSSPNDISEEDILVQRRTRALQFLQGRPIDDLLVVDRDDLLVVDHNMLHKVDDHNAKLVVDHASCPVSAELPAEQTKSAQSYILDEQLLQQLYNYISYKNNNNNNNSKSDLSGGFVQKPRRTTRRLHGCVHSSTISYSSSSPSPSSRLSSHSPLFHSRTSSTSSASRSSAHLQELQLQDQVVPSWEESPQETESSSSSSSSPSMDLSVAESHACRVYVLKDITEMHSLALAARTDALRKERASASRASAAAAASMSSAWTLSPHTHTHTHTTTTPTRAITTTQQSQSTMTTAPLADGEELNVTRQKLYCPKDNLDWSTTSKHSSHCHWASSYPLSSSSSPCSCPDASFLYPPSIERQPEDPGLLLLHVTRFGTVDHAISIPQQKQQQQHYQSIQPSLLLDTQEGRMVAAMANTSVMSYVHPDDTRALCQGLDRACKALYTVFRIRWRLAGQEHLLESDRQHSPLDSSSSSTTVSTKEASVRRIEFQGESFEEYIDPTAVPDASLTSRVSNDGHTLAKYIWAEITGVLSNSQPLLVVRPLTTAELFDQANEASLATAAAAAAAAAANSSMITSSRRSNARGLLVHEKKGWKTKSKRMDLEEGMRLPKQVNLSALTSLSMTASSHPDEMGPRMPGSLPLSLQQQQPSQQLMTATRCRNPSGHANPMPSFLAFPSNATLPWSGMFVTIALDAWRQWIQTVHAGQAQFRDWCEYLLETTIDQMIESLSLGLTLLGIEEAPQHEDGTVVVVGSYHQQQQQQQQQQLRVEDGTQQQTESPLQRKTKRIQQKDHDSSLETWASIDSQQHQYQQQKAAKHQQTLSGLHRAGKILEAYPSIEGVVRNIGKSWLGQKIKYRLEQKLDVVADQVVDWWEVGNEVYQAGWSPLRRSSPSGSGSSSSGAVVSELDESDVLLTSSSASVPVVVVGTPSNLVE